MYVLAHLSRPVERDDVSMPNSVKERVAKQFGDDVANAFGELMPFDPPPA